MSPILAIIVLLFVGLCFWGIWSLANKRWPGTPSVIIGIALLLLFLLIGLQLFGVHKFTSQAPMQVPTFRHAVLMRQL